MIYFSPMCGHTCYWSILIPLHLRNDECVMWKRMVSKTDSVILEPEPMPVFILFANKLVTKQWGQFKDWGSLSLGAESLFFEYMVSFRMLLDSPIFRIMMSAT